MKEHRCYMCKQTLDDNCFYRDLSRKTKVSSRCIPCRTIYDKNLRTKRNEYFKKYKTLNKQKINAKNKVAYAIAIGLLKKGFCAICGKIAEAHHDNYLNIFGVRWLCHKHHMENHRMR